MHYNDSIYGIVDIQETVLQDLMGSEAMQRLKGISQHGITALIGITPPFSRFDHSLGTMVLVRRLGASLDEQIAALLHDVSHTAFSHVIDFVFNDHSGQSYHEEKKEEFIARTDIPDILRQYGRNWLDYMDEEKYTLLEQASPALCADRLDYFFRDLEFLDLANGEEIRAAVESLVVKDGKIVVSQADAARWLAYTFIETDRASWSSFREVGLYQLTAEAIKSATTLGILAEEDLWHSDEVLWDKLRYSQHPEVMRYVDLITPGTRFTWDDDNPEFRVATKIRSIDPGVSNGNKVAVLSELDPGFGRYREEYVSGKRGLWPMSVVGACVSPVL